MFSSHFIPKLDTQGLSSHLRPCCSHSLNDWHLSCPPCICCYPWEMQPLRAEAHHICFEMGSFLVLKTGCLMLPPLHRRIIAIHSFCARWSTSNIYYSLFIIHDETMRHPAKNDAFLSLRANPQLCVDVKQRKSDKRKEEWKRAKEWEGRSYQKWTKREWEGVRDADRWRES